MKKSIVIILLALVGFAARAQDTLYKRNKEILVVKIQEIGLDEVKYKLIGYENGPSISIAKDNLIKVVFSNGVVQYMSTEFSNPENYAGQRKNAIKTDFMSPLRNNLSFVYERSIKPGRSIEANFGLVGVGFNSQMDDASGAFIRVGYKFIHTPDFYMRGMRYAHILKGGYIRPDLMFGSYRKTITETNYYPYWYTTSYSKKVTFASVQLSLGKQWIYDDAFLLDIFGGLGYTLSEGETGVNYGVVGGGDSPFSASGGIRIGFLFK